MRGETETVEGKETVTVFLYFHDPVTHEIYTHLNTLSLPDALPICQNQSLSLDVHSALKAKNAKLAISLFFFNTIFKNLFIFLELFNSISPLLL